MVDFETAAEELHSVDEQGLSQVSKLAHIQQVLEQRIESLEEDLKQAKRALREVAADQLPAATSEHNITELKLEQGYRMRQRHFYRASIPTSRAEAAFGWLVHNNCYDALTNQLGANLLHCHATHETQH